MEIVSILLIIVPLSLCLGFHLFGEDLEHPYRQHRHHQMSPKVLPSTSRAKNESWSECSDHISAADSKFVAGPPIQVPVIARWKMLSRVSWNCHIFTWGGPNWLLLSQSSSSWNCHILTWGGPNWLLSHGEKLDGTKFHRLQSQNERENAEILLDNLVSMYLFYSLKVLHDIWVCMLKCFLLFCSQWQVSHDRGDHQHQH